MKCVLRHKWTKWTKAVETANYIYKAQFRSCEDCNKIEVRYVKFWNGHSVMEVKAEKINEALTSHN